MRFEIFGEFGKEITLPCDVGGTPAPNVTWYRDGMPITEIPNLRYKIGSDENDPTALKINYLKLDDSSLFQCKAENDAGDIVGYSWLRVKSKSLRSQKSPVRHPALGWYCFKSKRP